MRVNDVQLSGKLKVLSALLRTVKQTTDEKIVVGELLWHSRTVGVQADARTTCRSLKLHADSRHHRDPLQGRQIQVLSPRWVGIIQITRNGRQAPLTFEQAEPRKTVSDNRLWTPLTSQLGRHHVSAVPAEHASCLMDDTVQLFSS